MEAKVEALCPKTKEDFNKCRNISMGRYHRRNNS